MKKLIALFTVFCTLLCMLPFGVYANGAEDIIYLEDGSYIITEISTRDMRASGTRSSDRTEKCISSDGTLAWKIVLSATFTYDGITARCTGSDCTVTIYDDAWYKISASDRYSAATAMATVQLGRTVLGITVEKPTYNLSLSCSPDGNIY